MHQATACAVVAILALAYITTGSVWVGHPATQAMAVQVCRVQMEPLMQPYTNV